MTTIKIAGVPEHFNYPWRLAIEAGKFEASQIDLQWTDVPEGTGKMCQMLRDGQADAAVVLTEGIVKDILAGNPSKIVQEYVGSPLIWGIHVAADSPYHSLESLEGRICAISRAGSGSQLMACVNAANQNWDASNLKFEAVGTIDGAVTALTAGRADYFMWERFMTKPLVDAGTFRRIGDCPTPWPCFMIAVRNEILDSHESAIRSMLKVINDETLSFKQMPGVENLIADSFRQRKDDVRQWISLTEWSQGVPSELMLNKVQNQLLGLSLIDKKGTFAQMVKAL